MTSSNAEPIVPLISSSTTGPLGLCHLPRLWLKVLLHGVGRLPDGFRHGTGGTDEFLFTQIGLDGADFVHFVESERPTYMQCETWVREHATNLNERSIAAVNEGVRNHKKPETLPEKRLLAAKQYSIGLVGSDIADPVMLNDLDDWTSVHAQVTKGKIPAIRASDLNAVFTDLLDDVFHNVKASRVTIRLDLPVFGFDLSIPRAEVNRPGLSPMVRRTAFGKAIDEDAGENPEGASAIAFMREHRQTLVQNDLSHPVPHTGPATSLRERFGICARILSPIFIEDDLVAWISVYDSEGPRNWMPSDVKIVERAAKRAQAAIESALQQSAGAFDAVSSM